MGGISLPISFSFLRARSRKIAIMFRKIDGEIIVRGKFGNREEIAVKGWNIKNIFESYIRRQFNGAHA